MGEETNIEKLLMRIEDGSQRALRARRLARDVGNVGFAERLLAFAAEIDTEIETMMTQLTALRAGA